MDRLGPRSALTAVVLGGALLLAGTGGAVAGSLVTGADIKDGTVTGADVEDGSLSASDLDAGAARSLGAAGSSSTARGLWTVSGAYPDNGASLTTAITLPRPAARTIKRTDVLIAVGPGADPTCRGTVAAPTAPRGKVCVYADTNGSVYSVSPGYYLKPSRLGFEIVVQGTGDYYNVQIDGSWAYTAP